MPYRTESQAFAQHTNTLRSTATALDFVTSPESNANAPERELV
jgi:hypothetical protein